MTFPTLFGRARETADLEAALSRAAAGRGSIFLLSGEAGIGKTRLAEEIAQIARGQGASVLWGRAWEIEGAPSCWPWIQVLKACAQTEPGAAFMTEPATRRLGALLSDERATAGSQEPEHEWLLLGSAIVALLHRLSRERPLVLVLDDLHASDLTSLNLLLVVARELRTMPVLVMGTYRELEAQRSPQLSSLLAKVGREGTVRPLGRLDEQAVTAWIASAFGDAAAQSLASAIFTATEGNPLFVEALSHWLASRGAMLRSWPDSPCPTPSARPCASS